MSNGMVTASTEIRIRRYLNSRRWIWHVEAWNGTMLIMSTVHSTDVSAQIEVSAWMSRIDRAAQEADNEHPR